MSLALPFERTGSSSTASFDVLAPTGQWLLSASVSPADLEATRDRWRQALATVTLAVTADDLERRNDGHGPPLHAPGECVLSHEQEESEEEESGDGVSHLLALAGLDRDSWSETTATPGRQHPIDTPSPGRLLPVLRC